MGVKQKMILLGGLSAFLLSLPFLVPHTGWLALFALVPLLLLEKVGSEAGVKRLWLWYYGVFVLWNAATTFWVCNATVGGGVFAVLANAFQMAVIFALFRASKKVFSGSIPYIFLAAAWIAWERFYFSAQISWPSGMNIPDPWAARSGSGPATWGFSACTALSRTAPSSVGMAKPGRHPAAACSPPFWSR